MRVFFNDSDGRGLGLLTRLLAVVSSVFLLTVAVSCGRQGEREERETSGQEVQRADQNAKSIKLLTYNVLRDPTDLDRRLTALMKLLGESCADVMALQEVWPGFFRRLSREPWLSGYHQLEQKGKPAAPGGLHVLSKFPIERVVFHHLPSRQARGVVVVHLRAHGRRLAVGTIWLESPLEDGPARVKQLGEVWPLLEGADDAVLMGDFNFGDGERPETASLDKRFVDLWMALRPGEPGYTWKIEKSEMARRGSFPGGESRRIDRILIRSKLWQPRDIQIIGDHPVRPGDRSLFPSDTEKLRILY